MKDATAQNPAFCHPNQGNKVNHHRQYLHLVEDNISTTQHVYFECTLQQSFGSFKMTQPIESKGRWPYSKHFSDSCVRCLWKLFMGTSSARFYKWLVRAPEAMNKSYCPEWPFVFKVKMMFNGWPLIRSSFQVASYLWLHNYNTYAYCGPNWSSIKTAFIKITLLFVIMHMQ